MEEVKLLTGLGSSGLLALIAVLLFRAYREDRVKSEDRLAQQCDDYRMTLIENTSAITRLGVHLEDMPCRDERCPRRQIETAEVPPPRGDHRGKG